MISVSSLDRRSGRRNVCASPPLRSGGRGVGRNSFAPFRVDEGRCPVVEHRHRRREVQMPRRTEPTELVADREPATRSVRSRGEAVTMARPLTSRSETAGRPVAARRSASAEALRASRHGGPVSPTGYGERLTLSTEELALRWGIHPESLTAAACVAAPVEGGDAAFQGVLAGERATTCADGRPSAERAPSTGKVETSKRCRVRQPTPPARERDPVYDVRPPSRITPASRAI